MANEIVNAGAVINYLQMSEWKESAILMAISTKVIFDGVEFVNYVDSLDKSL
jgi:hypothetical protein